MVAAEQATSSDTIDTLADNLNLSLAGYKIILDTPDEVLFGQTITFKLSGTTVGTASFDNLGHAEFLAPQPGTYTYEINSSGHLISDSVTVSDVSVTVRGALNWQDWVTAGGLDPTDYVSLQDVLNDEEAVRRLFTVHAAVDYLTSFT